MTNKARGAKYMPAVGTVGLLLLLGVLVLLYWGPEADGLTGADDGSVQTEWNTLLAAQAAIRVAREVLAEDSQDAVDALSDADSRLRNADTSELETEKIDAIQSLLTSIEAIQNGHAAQQAVVRAGNQLTVLLGELVARSEDLAEANVLQSQTLVNAQLQRLNLLGRTLRRDFEALRTGFGRPADLSLQILEADMALGQIVKGFENGDPELGLRAVTDTAALAALGALAETSGSIRTTVQNVLVFSDQLEAIGNARRQLEEFALKLALDEELVTGAVSGSSGRIQRTVLTAMVGIAMLILVVMSWISRRSTDVRKDAEFQAQQTERNQAAIIRLLDELGSLADGDLTVTASVTEDITGAIADSINYAIEELRKLVITLNDSAIMVDGAARQTDVTAQQLAEATEAQSLQIRAASEAIQRMAISIEEVSGNAERSSDVARHSVDVAHKGGDAVRRTIEGMNAIRETIQDTAKRIKRLGESSQEIGNIVELINDIADQTNILALNASIQASMAGEAGRGFAVVADEVQRLAERSANATRQIEVLVRTIQTDTNEAVVSMERSTTDVVGGALLAENAGAALEEIEQVSNQIASLLQNISSSAREQASAAVTVTRNMDVLQEINTRTEAGTSATTGSIRKLAELAAQLRESVAGFRLPESQADNGSGSGQDDNIQDGYMVDRSVYLDTEEVQFADQKIA
jgi:twitching motility protein PilJ